MTSSAGLLTVLVMLVALAACSRGTLQSGMDSGSPPPHDGGATDEPRPTDTIDAGPTVDARDAGPTPDARDGGPPGDAVPDGPRIVGRRSFIVGSTFTSTTDGGLSGFPSVNGHSFTMVLDADAGVAVLGTPLGQTTIVLSTSDGRTFGATSAFFLGLAGGCGSSVHYTALLFTIDGNGDLSGSGRARVIIVSGDVGMETEVTVSLSGRNDNVPPSLSGSGSTVNPLRDFTLRASEPMPASVSLALLAGNDMVQLATMASAAPLESVSAFQKPNVVLRYGTSYTVALDGFRDFAGNLGTTGTTFEIRTVAAPDAAAEDGFESATGTMLGGATIVSGAGMPVLTGMKSLYAGTAATSALGGGSALALRLPVAAGDKFIRFMYQQVSGSSGMSLPRQTLVFGSVGGTPASATINQETSQLTPFQLPDGTTIYLGGKSSIEIPLPATAAGEIVIERVGPTPGCGLPPRPSPGLLIDDLRVEP